MLRKAALLASLLLCAACAYSPSNWLQSKYGQTAKLSAFTVCRDYGCSKRVTASFSGEEWGRVRALFAAAPTNAAEERERVRRAVALIETMVGPKAGTANDRAGADIVTRDREGQLDCIDEAFNTSTYLRFLEGDRLLQWHDIGPSAQRGYIFNGWPHNTATIVERETQRSYTVDSWFHANGELPETVPLADWLGGWSPPTA